MSASFEAPTPTPIPTGGAIAITAPLSIADILDRSFRAMRARFGVLILSAAIVMVPLGLLTALLSGRFMTGYFDLLQYSVFNPDTAQLEAEQFFGNALGYFGAFVVVGILSMVGSTLVSLMSMHHIQRFLHGESSTIGGGWQVAIRRLLPMIGTQILEFVVIGLVTSVVAVAMGILNFVVVLVVGGAIAALNNEAVGVILGIGLVIVFVIGYLIMILLIMTPTVLLMGRWVAAGPSLLIEELGPMTALRRSWALTKGRMWRSILYVVLLTLLSFIIIGIPVTMIQWVTMLAAPSQLALIAIISTAVSYIVNLFYQPFYATGVVLFYYDLRVRAEAYDLQLRVAALEAEVAPDAPPA